MSVSAYGPTGAALSVPSVLCGPGRSYMYHGTTRRGSLLERTGRLRVYTCTVDPISSSPHDISREYGTWDYYRYTTLYVNAIFYLSFAFLTMSYDMEDATSTWVTVSQQPSIRNWVEIEVENGGKSSQSRNIYS